MSRMASLSAGIFASAGGGLTVEDSFEISVLDVEYAQIVGSSEYGADLDRHFPIASSTNVRVTGFRFPVNIPQGATITSAVLRTTHSQNATWTSGNDDVSVGFEQADSTTQGGNVTGASTKSSNVGSTVNHVRSGYFASGSQFFTPNLASLAQSVVNRVGWDSDNNLTIWTKSTGGGSDSHQCWSIGSPALPANHPRLSLEFSYSAESLPVNFIDESWGWNSVTTGSTQISRTHTLSAGAEAGDILLWWVGIDGGTATSYTLPSGLTLIGQYGVYRHTSFLYSYTITSGDISTGSVSRTFVTTPSDDENHVAMTVEVKNLNPISLPVQEVKNTSNRDVTSVSGVTLNSVAAGNTILALCVTTPDGGSYGLKVTNSRAFRLLGTAPASVELGSVMLHMGYLVAYDGGSYQGPDYANDSTTGPGNITNPALLELAPA